MIALVLRTAALLLFTGAALVAATPALGAPLIAYAKDGNVRVVRPDGGGDRVLVRDAAQPAWSPNGRRLAYVRGQRVYIGPAAKPSAWAWWGKGGVGLAGPSWSADSTRLAWSEDDGIFTWKVGKPPIRTFIASGGSEFSYPQAAAYGPRGTQLAWAGVNDFGQHLLVDIDVGRRQVASGNVPDVTPWSVTGLSLSWSGGLLLTTAQRWAPPTDTNVLPSMDGSPLSATIDVRTKRVTPLPGGLTRGAWAPDGRHYCGVDPGGALAIGDRTSDAVRVLVASGVATNAPGPACSWRAK